MTWADIIDSLADEADLSPREQSMDDLIKQAQQLQTS